MAIEAELPTTEEVNETESSFLEKPGTYHFAVTHANEAPQERWGDKKGQLMDGFEIEASVQAGHEKGKTFRFFVRNPNLSHKDQGLFCKALRGRWLEAIAVVDPTQRGKTVTVELVDSNGQVVVAGRQFIATMKQEKSEKGKLYIELSGAKVWHVDDPSADQCERNQEAIKLLPKKFRRDPASFAKPGTNGNGQSNGNGSAGQQSQQKQVADVDLDAL